MGLPPAWLRRPVSVTAWLLASTLALILSPLVLVVAELASVIRRDERPRIAARIVLVYFLLELGTLVACGGLWLASGCGWRLRSPRFRRAHYALLHWFVGGLAARVREVLSIDVQADAEPGAADSLRADQPVLVFSRHAGPADTVLLTDLLLTRYRRLPSVVFKDALELDPCIDLLGHRLPHAVLDSSDADECERRIREAAGRLGPRGALLLFPEGGNFTPERRRRSIATLWRKGRREQAEAGERMTRVLPPHPAGALAALRGNPDSDVIFAAHTGLGVAAFPGELWRDPPVGRTLISHMWRVRPGERPSDPGAQTDWLYGWWERIDAWVAAQGEESPAQ